MNDFDDQIRSGFADQRAHDRMGVPPFDDVIMRPETATSATRRRKARALWLAGTITVSMAAAAVAFGFIRQPGRRAVPRQPAVVAWRSPTASLIPASTQPVLAPAPLLSSVLDGATASTFWHKGD